MPHFDVSPAAPHELLPACRLLFADGRAESGRDRLLSEGETSGLFVARAGGRVRGAALVQALPGALGVAWPPRGESPEAEDAAAGAACLWLRARGVKVCQAFAGETEYMTALERAGFRHTTQVVFMRRPARPERTPIRGADERLRITFARTLPFADAHSDALIATHVGSLDCPELNAARTPAELVDGFQGMTTSEWYSATLDGKLIGLALVEPGDELTLSYLGIIPEARNRGLGAELLGAVLACATGGRAVSVSVDARNAPAVRLYARHGFAEYDRRGVWLATWPG